MSNAAKKKTTDAGESKPARKGIAKPAENVVDLEMSTGADSHMGLRLWLRMLTATNLVQAELRRRLRNEFDTTKTLENAIAAAATIGLRTPATARGIAATL